MSRVELLVVGCGRDSRSGHGEGVGSRHLGMVDCRRHRDISTGMIEAPRRCGSGEIWVPTPTEMCRDGDLEMQAASLVEGDGQTRGWAFGLLAGESTSEVSNSSERRNAIQSDAEQAELELVPVKAANPDINSPSACSVDTISCHLFRAFHRPFYAQTS
jgi:hypothetical protein